MAFHSRCSLPALVASLLALVALAGCHRRPAPDGAGTGSTSSVTTPSRALDRKALALADVNGQGASEVRIRALEARVRTRPEDEDGWILLGRAWIRRARESSDPGFYLHAQACADLVLERSPTNVAAQNLHGFVLLNQHAFTEAKQAAEEIVAREPRDPTAWGTLSDAALELGDFDGAVGAVEHMLELRPGLPAYVRASYLRFLAGDEAGAIRAVRLAIDSGDPSDPEPLAWVLVQAATLFFQRGDYEGADAGLRQALEVAHGYPPALVGRARVLLARGDAPGAGTLLKRAFEASPLVETGSLLVQALLLSGDADGAERAYAAAEREGLRGDRRSLAAMDATLGRHADRALDLARAERALRGDVYTEDTLAWALYRKGRFVEALSSIERACRLGTHDARLLFHHGAILVAVRETNRGRALLREALARSPRFEPVGADEAARLLAGRT